VRDAEFVWPLKESILALRMLSRGKKAADARYFTGWALNEGVRTNPVLDLAPAHPGRHRESRPRPRRPRADRCRAAAVPQVINEDAPGTPGRGIRMARAGFLNDALITAASFSRAMSRTLISSNNPLLTLGHHSTVTDGAIAYRSKRAAPRERPETLREARTAAVSSPCRPCRPSRPACRQGQRPTPSSAARPPRPRW
jgi:hypothetical protein